MAIEQIVSANLLNGWLIKLYFSNKSLQLNALLIHGLDASLCEHVGVLLQLPGFGSPRLSSSWTLPIPTVESNMRFPGFKVN